MTVVQRLVRLTTAVVISRPRLWPLLRAPFRRYFDALAPRWDAIVGSGHLGALEAALAEVPEPRRALDLGTGGTAAFLLAARYPHAEVTGIDVSPAMVAAARAKTPQELSDRIRFLEADAAALPLEAGSCDVVTLANMIPFFDEITRVIAPKGTLLVSFSEGAGTPIWLPPQRLRAELASRGFARFADFVVGAETCLLARRG